MVEVIEKARESASAKQRRTPNADREISDTSPDVVSRAERLRDAVQKAGGNRAVAAKAGVPLSTLGTYIAGRDMKAEAMIALADACEVSLEWLAKGTGPMKPGQPEAGRAAETRPTTLFGTINTAQLGNAMALAEVAFTIRKISPAPQKKAQVVCIIYDMLSQIADDPAAQLVQILSAIEEKMAEPTE